MRLCLVLFLFFQGNAPLLDNDYVRVFKNTAQCAVATLECRDRVVVALGEIAFDGTTLQRGDVRIFGPEENYARPEGGDFLEVWVKSSRPAVRVPLETVTVDHYNLILHEGDGFRVIEGRLEPGDSRPRHSHNQRLIIVLNGTRLRQHPDAGAPFFSDFVPDDVSFGEPLIHAMENVGTQSLRNIVIELKP